MTKYWDDLEEAAKESFESALGCEEIAKQHCLLVSGDKEFPDRFREKVLEIIVKDGLESMLGQNQESVMFYNALRRSRLLSSLHSLWHQIAALRVRTRFGVILDDPRDTIKTRELWEKETFKS